MQHRLITAFAVLVVLFALDLAAKALAQASLVYGQPVAVFAGFNFTLLFNPGVSFGLFPVGSSIGLAFMLGAQTVLCLGIAAYTWAARCHPILWPLLLLLSGALANLVDRFVNGAVTDYLDFYIGRAHWPAFNLADVWITVGVVGFMAAEFVLRPRNKVIMKIEK